MAWQRKIPFGYQVQNGRINCQPEEAKFVRSIFSHYLLGSSYSQIADEMARQGVRYHQHNAQWNKHMVKRILENERYLGMDGYPQLVTDEEFL
ncbi:MAG: recombinase family protein, partial [Firmicutes bacterium]|nr:recombinase family protein [Bacillota bacterium]